MYKCIAIITARGGSKRIPKKNIKEFCGKPIIAYSIEAAMESGVFDEVMVSTDSEEIADVARRYGAVIPFYRSEETSNDFASTDDVLHEVIERYENMGKQFESFCCIYPTAPFISADRLKEAYSLIDQGADEVIPVVKYDYPPQRSFVIRDGNIVFQYPENEYKRSQDLEPIYHDSGQFYFLKTKEYCSKKSLLCKKTVPLVLTDMEVQDIDTIEDWNMAELKYKILNNMKFD